MCVRFARCLIVHDRTTCVLATKLREPPKSAGNAPKHAMALSTVACMFGVDDDLHFYGSLMHVHIAVANFGLKITREEN